MCVSCHEHENISYNTSTEHTLLLYMIGDNSLSKEVESNLSAAVKGLLESETPLNLVVYRDNRSGSSHLPQLYQLKSRDNHSKVDTVFLKTWNNDHDSTDPKILAEVIRTTFQLFDTPIKGIEFWSHGLSWVPSDNFTAKVPDATATRAMEYLGQDEDNFGELWNIRLSLEKAEVHFDYMLFDACFSATAEFAYELRKTTDYMLFSPTEIMGSGFPYRDMMKSLSTIQDKETLVGGLTSVFEDYKKMYQNNGTFSLVQTGGLERLYKACVELEQANRNIINLWKKSPRYYEKEIQRYGRSYSKSRYFFYDLESWAKYLGSDASSINITEVREALKDCVLCHYHSEEFSNGLDPLMIREGCGLGLSIPQFWGLSGKTNLDAAYSLIQWQLE